MGYVLVFIVGHGDRSIDQAMIVATKDYDDDEHTRIVLDAAQAGVQNPEIIGQVEIPDHIAYAMSEGRIYVG